MPNDLRLRVGNVTATVTLGGTDQQVANALRRFAQSLGISLEGTAQEQLTAVLEHVRDDVRRRAKQVQRAELDAISGAQNQAIVDTDNDI